MARECPPAEAPLSLCLSPSLPLRPSAHISLSPCLSASLLLLFVYLLAGRPQESMSLATAPGFGFASTGPAESLMAEQVAPADVGGAPAPGQDPPATDPPAPNPPADGAPTAGPPASARPSFLELYEAGNLARSGRQLMASLLAKYALFESTPTGVRNFILSYREYLSPVATGFLLDLPCLLAFDSSFAEHLHGLRRFERAPDTPEGFRPLTVGSRARALAVLALLPIAMHLLRRWLGLNGSGAAAAAAAATDEAEDEELGMRVDFGPAAGSDPGTAGEVAAALPAPAGPLTGMQRARASAAHAGRVALRVLAALARVCFNTSQWTRLCLALLHISGWKPRRLFPTSASAWLAGQQLHRTLEVPGHIPDSDAGWARAVRFGVAIAVSAAQTWISHSLHSESAAFSKPPVPRVVPPAPPVNLPWRVPFGSTKLAEAACPECGASPPEVPAVRGGRRGPVTSGPPAAADPRIHCYGCLFRAEAALGELGDRDAIRRILL
ncbi:hypothetical protein H696_04318 [Fonticula alba]|uniref:Uncharacterized protein n=1 Tax=Fonticula alba TaxID=691883 RepID=A0A058Z3N5_FONAL|nr:hypothetical protein H696_04318 [Fonticula alba]KCV68899.1 hypothetical protein H696_04318 [Fonticula alba]|eukprot:XP_009496470.1 hypothetical protein H696_04318 [Fonticula alba]